VAYLTERDLKPAMDPDEKQHRKNEQFQKHLERMSNQSYVFELKALNKQLKAEKVKPPLFEKTNWMSEP
jgi:hypothetical protein